MSQELAAVVIDRSTGELSLIEQAIMEEREDTYLILSKKKEKILAYTYGNLKAIFLGDKYTVIYESTGAGVITFGILGLLYRTLGQKYVLYEKRIYAQFFEDSFQTNKFYRLSRNSHQEYAVKNFYDTEDLIRKALNFDFIPNNSSISAYTHTSTITTKTGGFDESVPPNDVVYGAMIKLLYDALTTFKTGADVHVQNDIRFRPEHILQTLLNCLRGINGELYAIPNHTNIHPTNATPLDPLNPDTAYLFDITNSLINFGNSDIGVVVVDVKQDIFHIMLINTTPSSALTMPLQDYIGLLSIKTEINIPDNFKVPFNITHTHKDGGIANNSIGVLSIGSLIGSVEFFSFSNSQTILITTNTIVNGGIILLKTLANAQPVITLLSSLTKTQEEIDAINALDTIYNFEDGDTYNQTGVGYWSMSNNPLYTQQTVKMSEFLGLVAEDNIEVLPGYTRRQSIIAHGDDFLEGNYVTGNAHHNLNNPGFIFFTDAYNLTSEGLAPISSLPTTFNDPPNKLYGVTKPTINPILPHTSSVFYGLTGNTYQVWDKGNDEGFEFYRSNQYIPPESISMDSTHGSNILTTLVSKSSGDISFSDWLFLYADSLDITATRNSLGVSTALLSPSSFLSTTVHQIFIYYLMDTDFNILEYCEVRMTPEFRNALIMWGDTIDDIMSPNVNANPNVHAVLFMDVAYTAFIEQGGLKENYTGIPLEFSAEVQSILEDSITKYNAMVAEGVENIIHNGWMSYEWLFYYTRYNAASGPEQYIIIEQEIN